MQKILFPFFFKIIFGFLIFGMLAFVIRNDLKNLMFFLSNEKAKIKHFKPTVFSFIILMIKYFLFSVFLSIYLDFFIYKFGMIGATFPLIVVIRLFPKIKTVLNGNFYNQFLTKNKPIV